MATPEPPKVISVATSGQPLEVKAIPEQPPEAKETPKQPSEVKETPEQPSEVKAPPNQPLATPEQPSEVNTKPQTVTPRPPGVIVRGRSNVTYSDLVEAGKHYLKEHFPDWVETKATCILPQIPAIAYNRALAPPLGEKGPGPKERGDDAELAVYKKLFSWGQEHKEPMFIIAQVDYDRDNQSKNTHSVLSAFLPVSKLHKLDLASKKLDIDFVIVHADIGAIIVEVKASENPLNAIRDATTSLRKGENFLQLFCHESFPIPVYKVAVFPNCSFDSKMSEILRLCNKNNIVSCDVAFIKDSEEVSKLFEKFKIHTCQILSILHFLFVFPFSIPPAIDVLLPWLISLKCLVSSTVSTSSTVSKVSLADDSVNLAKQVKKIDDKLTRHDVYSGADKKLDRDGKKLVRNVGSKRTKQVLYLNPKQLEVWYGPRMQIVEGVAGTGKTILIQHKVLELDKTQPRDEMIVVLATKAIGEVYKIFFRNNGASQRIEVAEHDWSWKSSTVHHIFMDETQHCFISTAEALREFHEPVPIDFSKSFIWIFLDPAVKSLPSAQQLRNRFKPESFTIVSLSDVMRCTPEIFTYWSKYMYYDQTEYNQSSRLFGQEVTHDNVANDREALKKIQKLLTEIIDGNNVTYDDCVVLIRARAPSVNRLAKFEPTGIKVLCMDSDIWSLEWSYVFLVGEDTEHPTVYPGRMPWEAEVYLASSRCKVKLFVFSIDRAWSLSHPPENFRDFKRRQFDYLELLTQRLLESYRHQTK